jgi:predicted transcriptional regulator
MTDETRPRIQQFVTDYFVSNHVPPSIREIADAVNRGMGTVVYHLDHLVAYGQLRRVQIGKRHTMHIPANVKVIVEEVKG